MSGRSVFAQEKPGWLVGVDLPGPAQAGRDVLHVRPFIPLLIPALLDEFPRCGRKAQPRGVERLGGPLSPHHHELDGYI